jgi:hypothetical protein
VSSLAVVSNRQRFPNACMERYNAVKRHPESPLAPA